jgi:hypothetical protein
MRMIAIALVCAACSSAPPKLQNTPAARETLGAELARVVGAGQSVAILPSGQGLVAISSDGARRRTLAAGKIEWVVVDPRAEVVWFGTAKRNDLLAIDLEAPGGEHPAVRTVVTDLPGAEVTIDYPPPKSNQPGDDLPPGFGFMGGFSADPWPASAHVIVEITAEPSLAFDGSTVYGMQDSNAELEKALAQAKIMDRAFLVELARRPSHDHPVELADAGKVPVDPAACGEAGEDCGKAEAIPGTPYVRVAVGGVCGDSGCGRMYRLYDPRAKQFLGPEEAVKNTRELWGSAFVNAWLAPDRAAFVASGRLIRFDRGIIFDPSDGDEYFPTGGGWVGGGVYVGF